MKNEAYFLIAESARFDSWVEEEKASYDAAVLAAEYRDRLYSEKGRALLDALEQESTPAVIMGVR